MQVHFMLWEQFIGSSLKAMKTLIIRPLQGYGNTASLSYPDTWVRSSDCLHLPYNSPLLASLPYNLHDVPLARRAEPCTHNPQQQYRL